MNTKHTTSLIFLSIAILFASCKKNFTDINTDPNNTPNALPQQLLPPALVDAVGYNMMRNRDFNNELMQVTVNMTDAEGAVFRYDYHSNWSDYLYNNLYSELTNFKDVYKTAATPLNYNPSYMGISLICQTWLYAILTDTYGDIPYSQSNAARDNNVYEPVFDKQKDIYLNMFKQLDTANVLLSAGKAIVASSDPVYAGNVAKWRKFGNSLYLRLLLRISGKPEVTPMCAAKIKTIVQDSAASYPIMASNDESAILKWTGQGPYSSPYLNVREQDFRAPGIASFFIDKLVIWGDPRLDIPTYGSNGINRWGIATYLGAFQGVPSGYTPGSNPVKKSYFYSNTSTSSLMTEPMTGMMMNYAELKFILAEAALKGWISGTAESYYNDGVLNSIKLWIPTWSANLTSYMLAADINWKATNTFNDGMEQIHSQKYYALFLNDLQQWFEYRRTGHPVLPMGAGLKNGGVMPARMTYPVYVQSTNPTNYQLAVAAQGPDIISTKVWWQKP
ncbi:MAG: SusD/RagB family nutrient-binding outer membrane lipoprotein [Ferruginibacter sp.]